HDLVDLRAILWTIRLSGGFTRSGSRLSSLISLCLPSLLAPLLLLGARLLYHRLLGDLRGRVFLWKFIIGFRHYSLQLTKRPPVVER
ncbi:hypothetical protein PFISCL1PPCAC_828, partial [Pristionchus fissidentatus]